MRIPLLLTITATLFMTPLAHAHSGQRIYIAAPGGKITTYQGTPDTENATSFAPSRVFAAPLPVAPLSDTWTTAFPGFQVATSIGGVSNGTNFGFSIAGPLYYFDYNNPTPGIGLFRTVQDKFSPGTVPQMAASQNSSFSITSSGSVAGFNFFPHNGAGDHGHLDYTLLGNGTTSGGGPNGVYALPLTLNGGSLTGSDTFYVLLGKNVALGSAEMNAAISTAQTQLVPEPGTVGVLFVAAGAMLIRRRRTVRA